MNRFRRSNRRLKNHPRKAATLVLATIMIVFLVGLAALGVDVGYVTLVRTQLQTAADAAAMAAASSMGEDSSTILQIANRYAGGHQAGGQAVSLASTDVEFGTWDSAAKTFAPAAAASNAIRVTARRTNATFFFGRIFGHNSFSTSASAVAMANPRDICFVIDLSGSMNDDAEPCWATYCLTSELTPLGYATTANDLVQNVYTDFGYGSFPGTLQYPGQGLTGVSNNNSAYANMTKNGGPLTLSGVNSNYKIASGDSEATRKTKAYRWIIDKQIAVNMAGVKPAANWSSNYTYWANYIDYVLEPKDVSGRGTLPPNQWSTRIDGMNNPNNTSFPSATSTVPQGYRNQIGYRTYVQFMMDHGRNVQPDGSKYTPLSTSSADCPMHSESTAGGTFSFPPREQPTHALRRALIAAIQVVKERNSTIPDTDQRDWVSVVSFDTLTGGAVRRTLTGDYDSAMTACTTLQAVGDNQNSTATETGMIAAQSHIKPSSEGGSGRIHTQKVIVLLTDGMPNLHSSSNGTVNTYRTANPSSDFYGGSNYDQDAAIMQAASFQGSNWITYPVGVGLGCEYDFMDRMARSGGTANDDGESERGSGNPAQYEQVLTDIFENIIHSPKVRLVQ